jgi:hypothetical protein
METLQITHITYLLSSLLFYPLSIALLLLVCWIFNPKTSVLWFDAK